VVLGRRGPRGSCVVDQDVNVAEPLRGFSGQAADIVFVGAVSGYPAGGDAGRVSPGSIRSPAR
jgi:hypothetical protein